MSKVENRHIVFEIHVLVSTTSIFGPCSILSQGVAGGVPLSLPCLSECTSFSGRTYSSSSVLSFPDSYLDLYMRHNSWRHNMKVERDQVMASPTNP